MADSLMTRRQLLGTMSLLAGGAMAARVYPASAGAALGQAATTSIDPVAAVRAQMAAAPIARTVLTPNLTMLSGPGGNVVVLNGPDGKVVADGFVQPAWTDLKRVLDSLGPQRLTTMIDTHWHFDHADNNVNFRTAGAEVIAHDNTKKRMSETHELAVLGLVFKPGPANALPTQTFARDKKFQANGEAIELGSFPPAHTDSDIYVRYANANVVHLGDTFSNGIYPYIDGGTGGSINGMIGAVDRSLMLVDGRTKVVPGHGPLGDRASLIRFRDMLVGVRDRVQELKAAGTPLDKTIAAKPTASFDAEWGGGLLTPDRFVTLVYDTL